MKSYLGLVPQYDKVHRKNNRISVLCIVLSVLLVTAIFSMADMALRAQKNYFIKTNGEYHISLTDIDEQTAELVKARIDVALCGWAYQGSAGSIGSKAVSFAGANEDTFSILTEMDMESGSYPTQPDEALLNKECIPYDLLVCYQYYDVLVVSSNGSLSQSGDACTLSIGSRCVYYNGKYASG